MKTQSSILTNLNRQMHKVGLSIKKHSPEILVGAGVVGVVASAVMACRATTKLHDILESTKENVDLIHAAVENPEELGLSEGQEYTEEDGKKDLAIVYAQTGLKLVKLYAPSVILGVASITSILAGNNILRKRNVALAAAYATVDSTFKEYRDRVVERFGNELDRELRYNIKAVEVEEPATDEQGNETTVKRVVNTAELNTESDYARFYDDGCRGWVKDSEANLHFLRQQEHYANIRLREKGYLFLNEVYEMLGIPLTRAGHQVGWIYDEKHPYGDNAVSFGIYNVNDDRKRAFVNGYERSILLDFNVDGPIYDLVF